jgi:hypothetical protein
MMLAPRITHFLFVPTGRPTVLALSRCPSVVLLPLVIILLVDTVLFRLPLDR